MLISVREGASTDLKIILDGLNFLNPHWIFHQINLHMINCHAASLVLELNNLAHLTIQNCTFGNWTFTQVQKALIKNCNNAFGEYFATSLRFYNSSAFVENMTIENEIITGDFSGIFICNYSSLHVKHSKFVNNTVKRGIIKTLKSSSLIMSNCYVSGNHATQYPGVILANESFVYLKSTYFNGNRAISGGGAIFIGKMSFLQIKNCTFKNNSVDETFGSGGAIMSFTNSSLDVSCSIFDRNKARIGGAIYQRTSSKMKLNQCSFFGNYGAAVVGSQSCEISIMNSIFQNNFAKIQGGAVVVESKCVLNVSNTTFKNNAQISPSAINLHHTLYTKTNRGEGRGAIFIFESVGNISKSQFHNNSATYWCGSMLVLSNCSLSISDTTFKNNIAGVFGGVICNDNSSINVEHSNFKNNSVSDQAFGRGGGLYLIENSTTKLSNVLFSKCHANTGGAIASEFTTIIMSNSFVVANSRSAIYLRKGNTLEINNSTFYNNSSPQDGGAIECQASAVRMVNTTFRQNNAVGHGGAVNIYEMSKLTAHNCSFTYNIAFTGSAMNIMYADINISDSNFSHNLAAYGVFAVSAGQLVMTSCHISNNNASGDGGVIIAEQGTLLMSNCLVFSNFANGNGGVVQSSDTEHVIITSIFKMNRALGYGGVFFVSGGKMLLNNSSFSKNFARVTGGLLTASNQAVINITKSFCFKNQARYAAGLLFTNMYTKVLISDTKISHNSADRCGAMWINYKSVLQLNGCVVEGNQAETSVGALVIENNSLLVALNSSFKGNNAYRDSSIRMNNSTAYLEKCTFTKNRMTYYGGTISTDPWTKLKISNTVFTQNRGYNLFFFGGKKDHFVMKFETYRCLFVHGNISLESNMTNFEEVAVKKKVVGQYSALNRQFFKLQETRYVSSKMFHILHIFSQ